MAGKTAQRLNILGEEKSLFEWARDSRCRVSYEALRNRIKSGMDPEAALTGLAHPGHRGAFKLPNFKAPYEAFGERKTLSEWCRDARCKASRPTLTRRIAQGMPIEQALSEEPMPRVQRGKVAATKFTAFGESKTVPDWARDRRCKVNERTLCERLGQGMPLTEALQRREKLYTAYGETKSIKEWAKDVRCVLSESGLGGRLRNGMEPEHALTWLRPPKITKPLPLFEAFGEWKTRADWLADPRCRVKGCTVAKRLKMG